MTETYTAWDGERYPWPPPDNWYLAADGRWWHPNSGPDGVGSGHAEEAIASAAIRGRHDLADPSTPSPGAELPRYERPSVTQEPDPTGSDSLGAGRPSKRRGRWWPWLLGLPLAAILGGVVAVLLFRDPGTGETASVVSEDTTSTQSTVETTVELESTTQSTAAETSATTVSAPQRSPDELVTDFREVLEENDLTSGSLSDEEIVTFGSTLCVFAASAEEPEDFEALREIAIADTESELSDVELSVAISAAIIVFCPLDAERLNIAL